MSFERSQPRSKNKDCPLPAYMQKQNHTRTSLNILNQKMLESNGFSIGRFQTVKSSFERAESHLKNKVKKKDPDDLSILGGD